MHKTSAPAAGVTLPSVSQNLPSSLFNLEFKTYLTLIKGGSVHAMGYNVHRQHVLTANRDFLTLWQIGNRCMHPLKTLGIPKGTHIADISYNRADNVYILVVNGLSGSIRIISALLDRTLFDSATYMGGKIVCGAFHENKQEVKSLNLVVY